MTLPSPPQPENPNLLLPENVIIRYTEPHDAIPLKRWLSEPDIARYFPMEGENEIEHGVQHWVSFAKYRCSLTAEVDGQAVGISTLWLQPYKKLAHQTEFGIIVDSKYRGMGIGTKLMLYTMELAKKNFNMEILMLQVFTDNPAVSLYRKLGFKSYGEQSHWIKETNGTYTSRTLMEKFL